MRDRTVATVKLKCGHSLTISRPPSRGESVYCVPCQDYRDVDEAAPKYTIRCGQCGLKTRSYGASRESAETAAHKHIKSRQTHIVSILDGQVVVARVANGDNMLPITLPMYDSQDHAKALRNLGRTDNTVTET